MRILYLLHAPFELPGAIEEWAAQKCFKQSTVSPYLGQKLPDRSTIDFIIAMGGPQSASASDPYLKAEISLLRSAIKKKIPVLGFCLGAQLMGEALFANTERSPFKEVGVFPVELTGISDPLLSNLPREFPAMHWHNDMPGLASDSVVLAKSAGCPRQIIRYAPHAYGFQCHPEMTLQLAESMVKNCAADLAPDRYVQTAEQILAQDFGALRLNLFRMLDNFLEIVEKEPSLAC